jgi:selenide,water dikinase
VLTGGCLGKVDAGRLLTMLRAAGDSDITQSDFVDAAVVEVDGPTASLATSTDLIYDFGMGPDDLGTVAVVHAMSDIYACLATPAIATICMGVTPGGLEDGTSATTLSSAVQSLGSLNVALGGGHTVYSERPFVAVTAIGLGPLGPTLDLDADADYDLVISKPIGSGIYLAALREGLLSNDALNEVRDVIRVSNREAAESLAQLATVETASVGFVTDVTGFGLLQAVQPRLKAHTRATILSAEVPTLTRTTAFVSEHALVTSLGEANMLAVHDSPAFELAATDTASVLILTDPQTSGGLLAAVRQATILPDGWVTIGQIGSSKQAEPKVVVV